MGEKRESHFRFRYQPGAGSSSAVQGRMQEKCRGDHKLGWQVHGSGHIVAGGGRDWGDLQRVAWGQCREMVQPSLPATGGAHGARVQI